MSSSQCSSFLIGTTVLKQRFISVILRPDFFRVLSIEIDTNNFDVIIKAALLLSILIRLRNLIFKNHTVESLYSTPRASAM